jgi:hypothetical protein
MAHYISHVFSQFVPVLIVAADAGGEERGAL